VSILEHDSSLLFEDEFPEEILLTYIAMYFLSVCIFNIDMKLKNKIKINFEIFKS